MGLCLCFGVKKCYTCAIPGICLCLCLCFGSRNVTHAQFQESVCVCVCVLGQEVLHMRNSKNLFVFVFVFWVKKCYTCAIPRICLCLCLCFGSRSATHACHQSSQCGACVTLPKPK